MEINIKLYYNKMEWFNLNIKKDKKKDKKKYIKKITLHKENGVLFLAKSDYANILYNWYKALMNVYNAKIYYTCIGDVGSKYNYERSANVYITKMNNNNFVKKIILFCIKKKIRHIIIEELFTKLDNSEITNIKKLLSNLNYFGCNIYWFHNGTKYRVNYKLINNILKTCNIKNFIYGADLYRYSIFNNKTIILPTYNYNYDIDMLNNKYKDDKIIILHCPSKNKGTHIIEKTVNSIIKDYENVEFMSITNISHEEVMKQKKESHIYIDQFCNGEYGTLDIGGFGVSSIESLSTGNIVLSLNKYVNYELLEDKFPIIDIKNIDTFEKNLKELLNLSKNELKKKSIESFNYFNNYISYNYIGNKLMKLFK
jgi:hypothetical protein